MGIHRGVLRLSLCGSLMGKDVFYYFPPVGERGYRVREGASRGGLEVRHEGFGDERAVILFLLSLPREEDQDRETGP